MAALGITVLKHNVPWGPFTREQIDDGLARGDFNLKYLAHAPGLKEWLPLGEVLDYLQREAGPRPPALPPVPASRELPPVPEPVAVKPPPPALPAIRSVSESPVPAVPQAPPVKKEEPKPESKPEVPLNDASFFARGFAFAIDCAILFVPVIVLYIIGALAIAIPSLWNHIDHESWVQEWELLNRNMRNLAWLVAVGFGWLYGAGMESSSSQATYGKRMMRIKVTDPAGERISFLQATGRYVAKYLSALPCFLGFIMALFSSRGLALHDRLADTRVVQS